MWVADWTGCIALVLSERASERKPCKAGRYKCREHNRDQAAAAQDPPGRARHHSQKICEARNIALHRSTSDIAERRQKKRKSTQKEKKSNSTTENIGGRRLLRK